MSQKQGYLRGEGGIAMSQKTRLSERGNNYVNYKYVYLVCFIFGFIKIKKN